MRARAFKVSRVEALLLLLRRKKKRRDDDESGELKERDPRETKAGKKLKNRISSRFESNLKIFFGPKKISKREEKETK